jgi:hypothetical protein
LTKAPTITVVLTAFAVETIVQVAVEVAAEVLLDCSPLEVLGKDLDE